MPVPNPDPTVTTATVNVRDNAGTVIGSGTLTVNAWELVIETNVTAVDLSLPIGTYTARVVLALTSSEVRLAPVPVVGEVTGTLGVPGIVTVPAVALDGHRSIDGNVVTATVAIYVEENGVRIANGSASIDVAAQPTKIAPFQVLCQVPIMDFTSVWAGKTLAEYNRDLDLAQDLGLDWVRSSLTWFLTQEISSAFVAGLTANADAAIGAAVGRGMKVCVIFGPSTPCWASSAPGKSCATSDSRSAASSALPTTLSDIATAVTAYCNRWAIDAIEVANEPNTLAWLSGANVGRMVTLTQQVKAGVLASTRPGVKVVTGGLSMADAAYLGALYDSGLSAGDYDAVSVHPYCLDTSTNPFTPRTPWKPVDPSRVEASLVQGIHSIHKVMRDHGAGTKPIWVTEQGWNSSQGSAYGFIDERTRAKYIEWSLRAQAHLPYVEVAGFFNLRDPLGSGGIGFGLADHMWRKRDGWNTVKTSIAALKVP